MMRLMLLSFSLFSFAVHVAAATASRPPPRGPHMHHVTRQQRTIGAEQHDERRLQSATARASNESATARLRTVLLSNYDKGSYPWTVLWEGKNETEIRSGLNVSVELNFHKVFDIDITNSVVDLMVWVRIRWNDPRLVWDPADYDGLQMSPFWIGDGSGAGGETSEIWTPDLELWNMEESLATSLTDAHAIVSPDGNVFWSRPGHIKPVCKFKGLEEFPFDSLKCTMEIGSWSFSGLYLRTMLNDGIGYKIGGSATAGEAFAEYELSEVDAEEYIYPPFPGAQSEDWPVLFYYVTFQRAWQPYARGYLTLQIVLNLAAFCCFWLPPHIGERMSLSITAVLAAVASELVVSENLPAASNVTWIAKFSIVSLMFAALALFESAIVIYFYYKTGDDLIPPWAHWANRKIKKWRSNSSSKPKKSTTRSSRDYDEQEDYHDAISGEAEPDVEQEGLESITEFVPDDEEEPKTRRDSSNITSSLKKEEEKQYSISSSIKKKHEKKNQQNGHRQRHLRPSITEFKRNLSMSAREGIKTVMGRDADDFKNAREMSNNLYWQKWARTIDDFSRVVFPVAYCIFLAVALSGTTSK